MSADRWNSWVWQQTDELLEYAERVERTFTQAFAGTSPGSPWAQPINVVECADTVWVITALPGVDVNDMEVRLEGNQLIIRGHRPIPECCMEGEFRVWEIPFGRFERRLRFSDRVPLSMGETRLERGLLLIQLLRKK